MQPQQPTPSDQNPYEFFMNNNAPAPPSGKFNLTNGRSMKQRILIVVGGAVGLLIIVLVFLSLMGGGGNGSKLLSVAQEQAEIIRIANMAKDQAAVRDSATAIFANNTSLSVSSSQQQILKLLPKGTKTSEKELGLRKNSKTDAALKIALQNNTYDQVFTEELKAELKIYQSELKSLYDSTSKQSEKQVLKTAYDSATMLLK